MYIDCVEQWWHVGTARYPPFTPTELNTVNASMQLAVRRALYGNYSALNRLMIRLGLEMMKYTS